MGGRGEGWVEGAGGRGVEWVEGAGGKPEAVYIFQLDCLKQL